MKKEIKFTALLAMVFAVGVGTAFASPNEYGQRQMRGQGEAAEYQREYRNMYSEDGEYEAYEYQRKYQNQNSYADHEAAERQYKYQNNAEYANHEANEYKRQYQNQNGDMDGDGEEYKYMRQNAGRSDDNGRYGQMEGVTDEERNAMRENREEMQNRIQERAEDEYSFWDMLFGTDDEIADDEVIDDGTDVDDADYEEYEEDTFGGFFTKLFSWFSF